MDNQHAEGLADDLYERSRQAAADGDESLAADLYERSRAAALGLGEDPPTETTPVGGLERFDFGAFLGDAQVRRPVPAGVARPGNLVVTGGLGRFPAGLPFVNVTDAPYNAPAGGNVEARESVGRWVGEQIGRAAWGYQEAYLRRFGRRSGFVVLVGHRVWDLVAREVGRWGGDPLASVYLKAWRDEGQWQAGGGLTVLGRPVLIVDGDDDGWRLVEGTGMSGALPAGPGDGAVRT
jgi:hypothetical protein